MWEEFKGLLGLCLFIALCCAMCGGVTYNGHHYGVSCSCDHGVGIE